MASVSQPLMSYDASGKFGNIVFVKGGMARIYTVPADANTPAQQAQRADFAAANEAANAIHSTNTIAALKLIAENPRYWRPNFIAAYLAQPSTVPANLNAEYDQVAEELNIFGVTVGEVTIPRAHILWHAFNALYQMFAQVVAQSTAGDPFPESWLKTWVEDRLETLGPQPIDTPNTGNWGDIFVL